jgi:CBS domain-containing protein
MNSLAQYLSSLPLSEFSQTSKNGGKVVTIPHDCSVAEAVRTLAEHDIYSAPIYNKETSEYIGMIDLIDIADLLTEKYDLSEFRKRDLCKSIFKKPEVFGNMKVNEIANIASRGGFLPISIESTLKDAVFLLAENNVHRLCVMDNENNLVNIISQSAVIEMIQKYNLEGEEQSIGTGIGTSPVVYARVGQTMMEALKILKKYNVYAVPVVGDDLTDNSIVSNISSKDVKYICGNAEQMNMLYQPISKFLASKNSVALETHIPSFTVKSSTTIRQVVDKIVSNKIHRVYVVDDKNCLVSVITLTDLLKALCV